MILEILTSTWTILLAGIVTAFLPCTYPVILGNIAYLTSSGENRKLINALRITFFFFLGFTATYILFGSVAGLFGQFSNTTLIVNNFKPILLTIGGIFFLLIGLIMLSIVPLPKKLKRIVSFSFPKWLDVNAWYTPSFVGVIFATGWSPCIGPILGGVLVLAATTGNFITGALYLAVFSVGIFIPLTIFTILYSLSTNKLKKLEKLIPIMRSLGGILFILLGVVFLSGYGLPILETIPEGKLFDYL